MAFVLCLVAAHFAVGAFANNAPAAQTDPAIRAAPVAAGLPAARGAAGVLPAAPVVAGLPAARGAAAVLPAAPVVAGLPAAGVATAVPAASAPEIRFNRARARQNYQLHCMGCHAEDGMGLAGHVPPIRLTLAPLLATSAGREYVLRVPGVAQSNLSSSELADVLNWILRDLSASPATRAIAPLSAAEVERFRHEPLLEVQGARARLLSTD